MAESRKVQAAPTYVLTLTSEERGYLVDVLQNFYGVQTHTGISKETPREASIRKGIWDALKYPMNDE